MKVFDAYLRRAIRKDPVDWSDHYIDYAFLKLQLQGYAKRRKALLSLVEKGVDLEQSDFALLQQQGSSSDYFSYTDTPGDSSSVSPQKAMKVMSQAERAEFTSLVEAQLGKAATFFNKELLGELNKGISTQVDYESVGNELLETFCFMVVNVISMRQILIRYDALVRTYDDGVPFGLRSSIPKFDLDRLTDMESNFIIKLMEENPEYSKQFKSQFEEFRTLLDKTFDSVERSSGGHVVFRDRFASTLRRNFLVGTTFTGIGFEPKVTRMRGRHLKKEMRTIAKWRETRQLPKKEEGQLDPENVLPLLLNLISCFLFTVNNYIIEPSSAYYAEALGSSDALSGIMIGVAPLFALISAVAYSVWTNNSYKQPILFAGCLMLIGNLMYANAYAYQSMTMCLIGRAVTGLGAPRIINRRYVADATPFRLRTAASAAFALATALGAAFGPGLAIVLDLFEFQFELPLLGTQYFNGMTGPGYFMALSWAVYTICIIITFEEPNRSGLDELRRMEAASSLSEFLMVAEEELGSGTDLCAESLDSSVGGNDAESIDTDVVFVKKSTSSPRYCIGHMTLPVVLCMSLIFMKRIALESIVGSTSVVTKNRYGWTIKHVGMLHTTSGTIAIPVSILSGWLSQFFEDRYLSIWLLGVTLFGMCFMVDLTDLVSHDNDTYNEGHWLAVGPVKYVAGSLIAFSGIEACESFVASLMSKVVPSVLAVGTFNSGLLTTLVGTSGRDIGDLFITLMGLISIRNLLNLLIIPGMALVIISIALIRWHYDILHV